MPPLFTAATKVDPDLGRPNLLVCHAPQLGWVVGCYKFAAITAVVASFFSPLFILPLFAPLNKSMHRLSISFWMEGSSIPITTVDSQQRSRYFSFVPRLKNRSGCAPMIASPHHKAVVLPVPEGPNAMGTGQLRYLSRMVP